MTKDAGETGTHDDDAELDGTRWDCGMLSMGRLGLRRALRPIVKGLRPFKGKRENGVGK
jgi:hypothetical protein